MTRRTRRLLIALPVALALSLAVAWLVWPRTAITRENAEKIQEGMTLAEVETILGGPPRDETTGPVVLDPDLIEPGAGWEGSLQGRWLDFMFVEPPAKRVMWHSDQVVVWVPWHAGCVNACDYFPLRRADESPIDMIRRWLRL
jgi:hypothetical protein